MCVMLSPVLLRSLICALSLFFLDKELADDLSKFYRDFLDGNYKVHSQYLR